jgi:hypothetical protein
MLTFPDAGGHSSEASFLFSPLGIVTGRLQRTRSMNGQEISDDWRFTKAYIRDSQQWRVIFFHASEATQR